MRKFTIVLIAAASAFAAEQPIPRSWDFNMGPNRATWLGITERTGKLDVWFEPTGGSVSEVKDVKTEGSHLTLEDGWNDVETGCPAEN